MLKVKGSPKHFWLAFVDTGYDNLEIEGSKNFIFDSILLRAIKIFYLYYLQFCKHGESSNLSCYRKQHSSLEIVFVTFEDSKIYSISDAFNKEQRGFCGESVLFN